MLKCWSFKRKLVLLMMGTATISLVLACSVFLLYELSRFRGNLSAEMKAIIQILADSNTAALTFEDTRSASESLAALKGDPRIMLAGIYDGKGKLFARYLRPGVVSRFPQSIGIDGPVFVDDDLEYSLPVQFDGRRIGTVFLRVSAAEMYERAHRYIWIGVVVLGAALLVAFLVSSVLGGIVSRPILNLTEAARRVSKERDYAIRASRMSDDELGFLVDQFNEMMHQIEVWNAALHQAQDELEDRVEERTSELRKEIAAREEIQRSLVAAKEAAEQANVAKSAFLANMSHELRTPLNAIIGYAELLQDSIGEEEQEVIIADLSRIHTAGRHLLALINDVLDLSKIEANRLELHYEFEFAHTLVEEAVATVRPLAESNGNEIIVKCSRLLTVETDLTRCRQSLLNLLSNACKFTNRGTVTVEVDVTPKGAKEWVSWQVRDTGIGIPQKDLPKLFQLFSQVDSSATRQYGGSGLGLAISRRLCRMMGGDLTVESEMGVGSAFTMWIPRIASIPADSSADLDQLNRSLLKNSERSGTANAGNAAG